MRLLRFLGLSLTSAALIAAGCATATGGREIPIAMTNYQLTPATIEMKAGEAVQFVLKNHSNLEHELESDAGKFEEVLVPGHGTRKVGWTAPTKAGDYEFECDMPGHEGMTMLIKVTE